MQIAFIMMITVQEGHGTCGCGKEQERDRVYRSFKRRQGSRAARRWIPGRSEKVGTKELKDGYYKVAEFTTESGYEKVLELLNEKQ